jgi:hypothetical protein
MEDDSFSIRDVAQHLCGNTSWSNAITALYNACDNNEHALFKLFDASIEDYESKVVRSPKEIADAIRYICWLISGPTAPVSVDVPVSAPVRTPAVAVRASAQSADASQPSRRVVLTQAERSDTESAQVHAASIARKFMYYKTGGRATDALVQWRRGNVKLSLSVEGTITTDYAGGDVVPEVAAVELDGNPVKLFADGTIDSLIPGLSALCAWYHVVFDSKSLRVTEGVDQDVLIMCIMAGVPLDNGLGEILRGQLDALMAVQQPT